MSEKTKCFFVHGLTGWMILLLKKKALKEADPGGVCFAYGLRRRVQNMGCCKKMSDLSRCGRERASGQPRSTRGDEFLK